MERSGICSAQAVDSEVPVLVGGDPAISLSFHDALVDHGGHIDWLFEGSSFETQEAEVENVRGVFCSPRSEKWHLA